MAMTMGGEVQLPGSRGGGANVTLADADGGTLLRYSNVEVRIGGKIAQLGQRSIMGSAKKLVDAFFAKLAEKVNVSFKEA